MRWNKLLWLAISLFVLQACGGEQDADCMKGLCPAPCSGESCAAVGKGDSLSTEDERELSPIFQMVLSRFTLEGGLDLDGNGIVDNQIGRLLESLKLLINVDLQAALDAQLRTGSWLLAMEGRAVARKESGPMVIDGFLGRRVDQVEEQSSSSKENFQHLGTAFQLKGSRQAGRISTSAPVGIFPLPLSLSDVSLPVKDIQLEARLEQDRQVQGILAGIISRDEAIERLVPSLVSELNRQYRLPSLAPIPRQLMARLLDLDADGEIKLAEATASGIFDLLLRTADIDSDGDGRPDAISFGASILAVPCTILRQGS